MNARRPAETLEQKMMDRCEKLYPKLSYGRCCLACLGAYKITPSEHIHHVIGRANPITRYYLPNLIPLCAKHHQMIHDGKMTEPITDLQREHLQQLANKSLKGICIARGITKAEYFEEQYKQIKEQVLI
jgi:hypothetical protein